MIRKTSALIAKLPKIPEDKIVRAFAGITIFTGTPSLLVVWILRHCHR